MMLSSGSLETGTGSSNSLRSTIQSVSFCTFSRGGTIHLAGLGANLITDIDRTLTAGPAPDFRCEMPVDPSKLAPR
jgi:hypothetical protein